MQDVEEAELKLLLEPEPRDIQHLQSAQQTEFLNFLSTFNSHNKTYSAEEESHLKSTILSFFEVPLEMGILEMICLTQGMKYVSEDFIAWCGGFFTLFGSSTAVLQLASLERSGLEHIESAPLMIATIYREEGQSAISENLRKRMQSEECKHPFTEYICRNLLRENMALKSHYAHVGFDIQILPRLTLMRYRGQTWDLHQIKTLWNYDMRGILNKLNNSVDNTQEKKSNRDGAIQEQTRLMFIVMRALLLVKNTGSAASKVLFGEERNKYSIVKFRHYKVQKNIATSSISTEFTEEQVVCFMWRICIDGDRQDEAYWPWGKILQLSYAEDIINLLALYSNNSETSLINLNVIGEMMKDKEITAVDFAQRVDALFQMRESILLERLISNTFLDISKQYNLLALMVLWGRYLGPCTLEEFVTTLPDNRRNNISYHDQSIPNTMVKLLAQSIGATLPPYDSLNIHLQHWMDSYKRAISILFTRNYSTLANFTLCHLPYSWKAEIKSCLGEGTKGCQESDDAIKRDIKQVFACCIGMGENAFLQRYRECSTTQAVCDLLCEVQSVPILQTLRVSGKFSSYMTNDSDALVIGCRIEELYKQLTISIHRPSFCASATKYVSLVTMCRHEEDHGEKEGVARGIKRRREEL